MLKSRLIRWSDLDSTDLIVVSSCAQLSIFFRLNIIFHGQESVRKFIGILNLSAPHVTRNMHATAGSTMNCYLLLRSCSTYCRVWHYISETHERYSRIYYECVSKGTLLCWSSVRSVVFL